MNPEQHYNNKIFQNLKDANCDSELIDAFFLLKEQNKKAHILKLLSKHRENLLNQLHDAQKRIDCLDYLIFNLKNS